MTGFGGPAVPALRMFDRDATIEFYTDHLGFTVEWEHRFEPDLPAYVEVRRGGVVLHLSEHFGDGGPTVTVIDPSGNELRFAQAV